MSKRAPLGLYLLCRLCSECTSLSLCVSVLAQEPKFGGHSEGFSRGIRVLFLTFWLAEAAGRIGRSKPSVALLGRFCWKSTSVSLTLLLCFTFSTKHADLFSFFAGKGEGELFARNTNVIPGVLIGWSRSDELTSRNPLLLYWEGSVRNPPALLSVDMR